MPSSKLQRRVSEFLSVHFGKYKIQECIRPDWLLTEDGNRLELDFYIEELELAIEVQGEQHYKYIEHFFGNISEFEKRLEYDRIKKGICQARGINLVEICDEADVLNLDAHIPKDKVLEIDQETRKPLPLPDDPNDIRAINIARQRNREIERQKLEAEQKISNLILGHMQKALKTCDKIPNPKERSASRNIIMDEFKACRTEILALWKNNEHMEQTQGELDRPSLP